MLNNVDNLIFLEKVKSNMVTTKKEKKGML